MSAPFDTCRRGDRFPARGGVRGFTLIELAIAIFVVGLILGSILVPISTQVEQRQVNDTQKTLAEIKDALIGFAVANRYLPCPDTDNDGLENVNAGSGQCSIISSNIAHGNLPWQMLGVGNADVWGNRLRYAVREQYARRAPATPFTLSTTSANLRVCDTAATCGTALTSSAVAVILSHGRNGYGATSSISGGVNPGPTSADEQENTDADRDFVSRPRYSGGLAASEFDDIVVWLPGYTLANRMVSAGVLP